MPPSLSVLTRHRDFRRLFLAELAVFGGDWFVLVPLLVLLNELTGSGLLGALVLAADTGILAVMLPFAGAIADRFDRKKIMVASNLAAIAMVVLLFAVRSADTAWLAVVAVALFAVAKAFYTPAASAALPNLVPPDELATANAVASSAWGTMAVVGASIGGVLSAAFSPYIAFAVTALALVAAAALVWGVRQPMQTGRDAAPRAGTASESVKAEGPATPRAGTALESVTAEGPATPGGSRANSWSAIREGLRYIGGRPRVLALVTVKSAVGLGNGVLTVFPLLAVSFGVGPTGTGLLFAVRGLGALLGPLLLRRVLLRRNWLLPGLSISMATYGLAYVGASVAPWFPLVLTLVTVAHLAGGGNWAMSNYALQAEVPDGLRGRVFATDMMLATLAISCSQLVVGAMVDTVNMHVLVAASGATTMLYAIGWRVATAHLARPAAEASN